MAADIKIRLGFEADTKQAKQDIQGLVNALTNINNNSRLNSGGFMGDSYKEITKINKELGITASLLKQNFSSKTGNLDVLRFTRDMSKYGLSVKEVGEQIRRIKGQDAFLQFNNQIATGTTKLNILHSAIGKIYDQMVRTAKIQMSYTVLNSITNSFRSAYNYAESLNKSLNNIRIVTGQSNDEMASFAKQANKAAQALSTTTTAYTDAALIYYQQGLSNEEVKERTDATIKMANVSGQSAQEVSSQMTAIWNNFDDGSKSLEYYADVITKLGASTASSSAEIAAGLQQFAAVSDTVGLSYEKATAALATVVATTRQSADSIGNSFKTIFARLESLNMGETLDDDTDLTKYTKALAKAGVDIKLGNGELKAMDTILDELGEKWAAMNQEQKNAVAYTVAGARQYTNFIALMDNYDKVLLNQNLAENSEGTLQDQADIYADSWEAAQKRVKAALEDIYTQFISDKFFIALNNGAAEFLKIVGSVTKAIGGIPGVLGLLIPIFNTLAGPQILNGITRMVDSVMLLKTVYTGEAVRNQQEANDNLAAQGFGINDPDIYEARVALLEEENALLEEKAYLSEEEYEIKRQNIELRKQELELLDAEATAIAETSIDIVNSGKLEQQSIEKTKEELNAIINLRKQLLGENNGANRRKFENMINESSVPEDIKARLLGVGELGSINHQAHRSQVKNILRDEIGTRQSILKSNSVINKGENDLTSALNILSVTKQRNAEAKYSKDTLEAVQNNFNKMGAGSWNKKIRERVFGNLDDETAERYWQLHKYDTSNETLRTTINTDLNKATAAAASANNAEAMAMENASQAAAKLLAIKSKVLGENYNLEQETQNLCQKYGLEEAQVRSLTEAEIKRLEGLKGEDLQRAIDEIMGKTQDKNKEFAKNIQSASMALSSMTSIFSSLHSVWQTFNDDTASGAEKVKTLITVIPVLLMSFGMLQKSLTDLEVSILGIEATSAAFMPMVIAIGAAIAGVMWLIGKAYDEAKAARPEEQLKKAKEETEALTAAADGARQSYEDLQNQIESLESSETEISKLVKGTKEWEAAVKDLNDEYKQLITTYRLAYGEDWNYNNDGKIEISQKALDRIEREQNKKFNDALTFESAAQINEKEKELVAKRDETLSSISDIMQGDLLDAGDGLREKLGGDSASIASMITAQNINEAFDETGITWMEKLAQSAREYADGLERGGDALQADAIRDQVIELEKAAEKLKEVDDFTTEYQGAVISLIENSEKLTSKDFDSTMAALSGYREERLKEDVFVSEETKKDYAEVNGLDYKDGKFYDAEGQIQEVQQEVLENYTILKDFSDLFDGDSSNGEATVGDRVSGYGTESQYQSIDDYLNNEKNIEWKEYTQSEDSLKEQEAALEVSDDLVETYKDLWMAKSGITSATKEEEEAYKSLILRQIALNKGLEELSSTWDDYAEVLEKSGTDFDETSLEYVEGLTAIKQNLAQVFEVDVSTQFVKDHLDEIEKLAKGDVSVFNDLGKAAAKDYVANLDVEAGEYKNSDGSITKWTPESVRTDLEDVIDGLSLPDVQFGATLDDSEYLNTLNEMLKTGQITADQANSILASIGYDADIEKTQVPVEHEYTVTGPMGLNFKVTSTEMVEVPKINGKKTTFVGSQGIDTSNRTGGSNTAKGSKASSGSGSGSSKEKTAERYHSITKQINSLEKALDRVKDAEDKTFGEQKIALMDKEIEKYEELIKANEKYAEEIQANYLKDQALMNGYGAQYDANGNITNYEEIFAAHGQEDDFDTNLKNYEESLEKWVEVQDTIQKYRDELYSKQLEEITYAVEFKVEIDDAKLKRLDWLLKNLDDDTYDLAESMANLNEQAGIVEDKMNSTMKGLEDWRKFHSEISDDDWAAFMAGTMSAEEMAQKFNKITAEEKEQLIDWSNELMDCYDELKEFSDTLQDDIVKSFQKFSETIDDQASALDHLTKMLNSYKNIINLTGRKELGVTKGMMNAIRQQGIDLAVAEEEVATAGYQSAKQEYMKALADPAVEQETLDELKKTLDSMEEKWISSLENTLQMAKDRFKEVLEDITNEFEEKMGGIFGTLSNMSDMFEKQNTLDDLYLKTYEQSYELSKLMRQLDKSIDDSSNIKSRQKLMELQQEITDIQESGKEINEYDLEVLQKKYDLYLAQIALEDAREAKSQVRMTRDNEGNMSYVYTADMSAVDDANQNYEDKLYDLEKVTQDRQGTMQAQMLQEWQNYEDAISQLDVSDRERGEMLKAYWEELNEKYSGFLQDSLDDANWVVEELGVADDQLVNKWDETVLAYVTGFDTLGDLNNNFLDSSKGMFDELQKQYVAYDSTVDAAYNAAGLSTTNFTNTINEELGNVQKDMDETTQKANEFSEDFSDAFDRALGEVDKFASEHAQYMENARQEIDSVVSKLGDLIDAYGNLGSAAEDAYQQLLRTNELANSGSKGNNGTGTTNTGVDENLNNGSTKFKAVYGNVKTGGSIVTGWLTGSQLKAKMDSDLAAGLTTNNASVAMFEQSSQSINTAHNVGKWISNYLQDNMGYTGGNWQKYNQTSYGGIQIFDTGGYTGQWGVDGRLAMLHEKEIVLNKEDTKNFLEGIGILREIDNGYSNLRQYADAIMSTGTVNNGPSEIQQTVTINADFPGVSSQYEIESAFENLFSRASQYVNRKV